jgi:F-type H+-transporting ATPase subunit b
MEDNINFLLNHAYSFWFALGAFMIFFFLLAKFAIKPVVQAIDARDAKIARDLKESEDAYTRAKTLKDQLDAQLRGAEAKIGEMMNEARRDAEAHKVKMVETGRVEIDAIRTRSLREIEAARQSAIIHLRSEVAEISTSVAEKILRQNLDAKRHEQLVAQAIDAYEKTGAVAQAAV